jgi:hypothetical protein
LPNLTDYYPVIIKPTDKSLFAWLISHQPAVLFSHNKPATSNQSAVLFSQNKPAPAISHQSNEQVQERASGKQSRRSATHASSAGAMVCDGQQPIE